MIFLTALALFITIPCIMCIFYAINLKDRDQINLYSLLGLLLVSLYFAFFPYVQLFQDWFNWHQFFNKFMSIAALGLAIFASRRQNKMFLCGMMVASAALIACSTFDMLGEIWKFRR